MNLASENKAAPPKTSALVWVQRAGFLFVGLVILWYLPRINYSELREVMERTSLFWVSMAVASILFFWSLRALLLRLITRVRYRLCFLTNLMGMVTDQILPGRVGHIVRWWLLTQSGKLPKSMAVFSLLAFVILEACGLVGFSLVAFFIDSSEGMISIKPVLGLLLAIGSIGGVLLVFPTIENWAKKYSWGQAKIFHQLSELMLQARRPRTLLSWLLTAFIIWFAQVLIVEFVAYSIGKELSFQHAMFLLLAINLAIAVPIVPGNIGSMHLVITTVLKQMSFSSSEALAFALLYHGLQFVLLISSGAIASLVTGLRPGQVIKKGQNSAFKAA